MSNKNAQVVGKPTQEVLDRIKRSKQLKEGGGKQLVTPQVQGYYYKPEPVPEVRQNKGGNFSSEEKRRHFLAGQILNLRGQIDPDLEQKIRKEASLIRDKIANGEKIDTDEATILAYDNRPAARGERKPGKSAAEIAARKEAKRRASQAQQKKGSGNASPLTNTAKSLSKKKK